MDYHLQFRGNTRNYPALSMHESCIKFRPLQLGCTFSSLNVKSFSCILNGYQITLHQSVFFWYRLWQFAISVTNIEPIKNSSIVLWCQRCAFISPQNHFTPYHFTPYHFIPYHFIPYHFTPHSFHPTIISPQNHFTPHSFHMMHSWL